MHQMQLTSSTSGARFHITNSRIMPNDNNIINLDSSDEESSYEDDSENNTISSSTDVFLNTTTNTITAQPNNNIEQSQQKLCVPSKSQLLECTLKALDKQQPCMTAKERVLNWNLAKNLSIKMYPIDDDLFNKNLGEDDKQLPMDADDNIVQTSMNNEQKYRRLKTYGGNRKSRNSNGFTEYKLNSDGKKCPEYQFNIFNTKYREEHSHSSTIKLRYSYGAKKDHHQEQQQQQQNVFKVPETPMIPPLRNNSRGDTDSPVICDEITTVTSTTQPPPNNNNGTEVTVAMQCNVVAPLSPNRYKEEFYKYLRIDTNPGHHHDKSNKSDNLSGGKRRSLRVKVQQIAINNLAKYNKEQQGEMKKKTSETAISISSCDNSKCSRHNGQIHIDKEKCLPDDNNEMENNNVVADNDETQTRKSSDKCRKRKIKQNSVPKENSTAIIHDFVDLLSSSACSESIPHSQENHPIDEPKNDENNQTDTSPKPASLLLVKRSYGGGDKPSVNNKYLPQPYKAICLNPSSSTTTNTTTAPIQSIQCNQTEEIQSNATVNRCSSVLQRCNYNKKAMTEYAEQTKSNQQQYQVKILAETSSMCIMSKDAINTIDTTKRIKYTQEDSTEIQCENDDSSAAAELPEHNDLEIIDRRITRSKLNRKPINEMNLKPEQEHSQSTTNVENKLKINNENGQIALAPAMQLIDQTELKCCPEQRRSMNFEQNKVGQKMRMKLLRQKYLLQRILRTRQHHKSLIKSQKEKRNYASVEVQTLPEISQDVIDEKYIKPDSVQATNTAQQQQQHTDNSIINNDPMIERTIHQLQQENKSILAILHISNTIISIEEDSISFWMCPSRIYTTFTGEQKWKIIGKINRQNIDTEIMCPHQKRICKNDQRPIYYELRAKQFEPNEVRECYITSLYVAIYFIDKNQDIAVQYVELDKISCMSRSIRYVVLAEPGSFAMSWTEKSQSGERCGLCVYYLETDLETLHSVKEFSWLKHRINELQCLDDDKLLGFGTSIITMWNYKTGDLLMNIDIELSIGGNLGCFLWNENKEECLYLAQLLDEDQMPSIKLIAIKLTGSYSYTILATHRIPLNCKRVTSVSLTSDRLVITFMGCSSLIVSLQTPTFIHLKCPKNGQHRIENRFVQNNKMYSIVDKQILIKTIYEHFLADDYA